MSFRLLVCGGRDYADRTHVYTILDRLHALRPITTIIQGECHKGGADLLAEEWAKAKGIENEGYRVDTNLDGPWPAAGNRRNLRMLLASKPHAVVAFPGGNGTRNMVRLAQEHGVPVVQLRPMAVQG